MVPLILALVTGQVLAAEGSIAINSPANGTIIGATMKIPVNYEAMLSDKGDHLHLYVDDKRIDVLRQLKGTAVLDPLKPGKHKVCLTENTKWHMSTGLETCVEVMVQ
jgi:hypothetical protein